MKPAGPLMIEHRLIEKMIALMKAELDRIRDGRDANLQFLDDAVDFIRTYADRTHHGKEEDILFRDLRKKKLSTDHQKILQELIDEHIFARKKVGALVNARQRYQSGDLGAIEDIKECLETLVDFYPRHIEKEDRQFFMPVMYYFTPEERDGMLKEFREFDRKLIHEKYKAVVVRWGSI